MRPIALDQFLAASRIDGHMLLADMEVPVGATGLFVPPTTGAPPGCSSTGPPWPASKPAMVRCILDSLASAFARALAEAIQLAGRDVKVVHIVGGGAERAPVPDDGRCLRSSGGRGTRRSDRFGQYADPGEKPRARGRDARVTSSPRLIFAVVAAVPARDGFRNAFDLTPMKVPTARW